MDEIIEALASQFDELRTIGAGLDEAAWAGPSACDGWSRSDVLLHLSQTNDLALASVQDRFPEVAGGFNTEAGSGASSVDDAADASVAMERGASGADVLDRWSRSADAFLDALESADPHARVTWVAGRLSVRTLTTTRLAETWIHTGDVAFGLGIEPTLTPQLRFIARLAWRTLPYALDLAGRPLHGPVALDLEGVDGGRWTFGTDDDPLTTVTGSALDLCLVAARRLDPADSSLRAEGPDGAHVLALIRTYA